MLAAVHPEVDFLQRDCPLGDFENCDYRWCNCMENRLIVLIIYVKCFDISKEGGQQTHFTATYYTNKMCIVL